MMRKARATQKASKDSPYTILSVKELANRKRGIARFDRDHFSALVGQMPGFLGMLESDISVPDADKILAIESEFIDLGARYKNESATQIWFRSAREAKTARERLKKAFPQISISPGKQEPKRDWSRLWRTHYKVQRIERNGEKLWIIPAWESLPKELRQDRSIRYLWIHPGQAFGAGTHPTTKLCLELMLGELDRSSKKLRILDFGAGTGILGIAAARSAQSAGRETLVDALEVDRAAVDCLKKNAQKNRVSIELLRTIPAPSSGAVSGSYNLIFANVLAPVLEAHSLELLAAMSPDGSLILSGILKSEAKAFMNRFLPKQDRSGFLVKAVFDGDWAAFLIRRTTSGRRSLRAR